MNLLTPALLVAKLQEKMKEVCLVDSRLLCLDRNTQLMLIHTWQLSSAKAFSQRLETFFYCPSITQQRLALKILKLPFKLSTSTVGPQ